MTVYTNQSSQKRQVSFAAPYAGKIIPLDLSSLGQKIICQKDSFLCAAKGVQVGIEFQKKLGTGLFGGEGFIMQKLEGDGMAFVHSGGHVIERVSTLIVAERPAGTSRRIKISLITSLPPVDDDRRRGAEEGARERIFLKTRVPVSPNVSMAPLVFGNGPMSIGIAGAELTQLNEGLREFANIRGNGIFVINVPAGSLAGAAGLRSGDVIVRVEKQLVETPGQLIRLMEAARESAVRLQILRKQKLQNLTLRW
jgi:S1-C subfamily serine protease